MLLATALANAQDNWVASTIVEDSELSSMADEAFQIYPITDALFNRMYGLSYKENCTIPRDSLRYLTLLHHNGKGEILRGELVCHESIAADLIDIFKEMYEIGYPHRTYGAYRQLRCRSMKHQCKPTTPAASTTA